MVYLPGYTLTHHARLIDELSAALAPSTWRNKASHINTYIQFCSLHHVRQLAPSVYNLLSFLLFLKDRLKSVNSIMNYFSTVKLWVIAAGGDKEVFNAPEVYMMKRGLIKNSTHAPSKAPNITPSEFQLVVTRIRSLNPCPYVIPAALLLMYFTLARQGNIVATSGDINSCQHLLRYSDVTLCDGNLYVTIRSTKTHFASSPSVVFKIPQISASLCCPVTAWSEYTQTVNLLLDSPALVLPTGEPLTARILLRALKLTCIELFGTDNEYTLHSIRRGATQACQSSGLSIENIMAAGMWRSGSVNTYLHDTLITSAPSALAKLFGER